MNTDGIMDHITRCRNACISDKREYPYEMSFITKTHV